MGLAVSFFGLKKEESVDAFDQQIPLLLFY